MRSKLRLSVLDALPRLPHRSTTDLLNDTVQLARHAEALGYHRYWLSEHRHSEGVSSRTPEVMLAVLGAQTKRMRVGTGGMLLLRHGAEQLSDLFETLAALYPGRIDLGVARGLNSAQASADESPFEQAVVQLQKALARRQTDVDLWLLGSRPGGESQRLAIQYGTSLAFGNSPSIRAAATGYRTAFRPSSTQAVPQDLLTLNVVCAETTELARELAWSFQQFNQSQGSEFGRVLAPRAARLKLGHGERSVFSSPLFVVGTPAEVRTALLSAQEDSGCHELMIQTTVHDPALRAHSYALIAEALAPWRADEVDERVPALASD
ncbi:MsnO8 family LLM class oxidoreductase [Deinococcus ruber]|uniref:Luciferase-like domain-containing protein n=1 Tax=Deinococcus ruber TaxID=1848197 RepID=A0A918CDR8_9DEIO|nr:MsnO8 family LLM class oxidoreductase [Deinococcus ruber]GGR20170.1 hypothetical protein GCM10008957_35730 [Deinococcus ruber]